jgi:hypothetical protein
MTAINYALVSDLIRLFNSAVTVMNCSSKPAEIEPAVLDIFARLCTAMDRKLE